MRHLCVLERVRIAPVLCACQVLAYSLGLRLRLLVIAMERGQYIQRPADARVRRTDRMRLRNVPIFQVRDAGDQAQWACHRCRPLTARPGAGVPAKGTRARYPAASSSEAPIPLPVHRHLPSESFSLFTRHTPNVSFHAVVSRFELLGVLMAWWAPSDDAADHALTLCILRGWPQGYAIVAAVSSGDEQTLVGPGWCLQSDGVHVGRGGGFRERERDRWDGADPSTPIAASWCPCDIVSVVPGSVTRCRMRVVDAACGIVLVHRPGVHKDIMAAPLHYLRVTYDCGWCGHASFRKQKKEKESGDTDFRGEGHQQRPVPTLWLQLVRPSPGGTGIVRPRADNAALTSSLRCDCHARPLAAHGIVHGIVVDEQLTDGLTDFVLVPCRGEHAGLVGSPCGTPAPADRPGLGTVAAARGGKHDSLGR